MLFTGKTQKDSLDSGLTSVAQKKKEMFFSPKFCQLKKSIYICREVVKLLII